MPLSNFEAFDEKEDWTEYSERFQQFLIVNNIEEAPRKRALFFISRGRNTYRILRNLITPKKPEEETFENLVAALQSHFKPAPSEIVEGSNFIPAVENREKSIETYVSELRSLSESCNFGEVLEDMIRDRIVCGVNGEMIQKQLLAELKLTYKREVELTQSLERVRSKCQGTQANE